MNIYTQIQNYFFYKNLGFVFLFRETREKCITTANKRMAESCHSAGICKEASWAWKDWIWGLKNECDLCKKPEHNAFNSNKDAKFKVNYICLRKS